MVKTVSRTVPLPLSHNPLACSSHNRINNSWPNLIPVRNYFVLQNKKGTEGWGASSFFNFLSRDLQPIVRGCELYGIGRMKLI